MTRPYLLTTWARRRTWAELTAPLSEDEYRAALADTSIEDALERGRVEAEREREAMRSREWLAMGRAGYGWLY